MDAYMTGTSIQDLQQRQNYNPEDLRRLQEINDMKYNAMQNLQFEQGHNVEQQIQQGQHDPYYRSQPNYGYPGTAYAPPQRDQTNISDLVSDINDKLGDLDGGYDNEYFDSSTSETGECVDNTNTGVLSFIPTILQEPLTIIVLFVILSQPVVKTTIGRYIKQINPDATGKVSLLGIIIYGTLLAVLYSLTKKFLLK